MILKDTNRTSEIILAIVYVVMRFRSYIFEFTEVTNLTRIYRLDFCKKEKNF